MKCMKCIGECVKRRNRFFEREVRGLDTDEGEVEFLWCLLVESQIV